MKLSEPIIHVGIVSAGQIEFVLNGIFVDKNKTEFSGRQVAKLESGKIRFNDLLYDELNLEPLASDASFDLIDVVIGISFHWERKENQRFNGSLKLIIENEQLRKELEKLAAENKSLKEK